MLESKRKAIIFFSIALLLALTAGMLILKKVQALNTNLGTMVQVAVASQEVPSRKVILPEDVAMEEIPQKYVKSYHVTDVEDLKNKVSIVPLSKGDVITQNMLKQASSVVEENNRLISLMRSDRITYDEQLEALDRVDIIVSHRFDSKEETDYFMRDVKVAQALKKGKDFKGVLLEVPAEKAPELIHMQNYADSVRVVKANVGQWEEPEEQKGQEKPKQEKAPEAPAKEVKEKQAAKDAEKAKKAKEEEKKAESKEEKK
ncbi:Flp pilus assembly protein CpaB [Bacillus freudenreichii]|nr:Flp pilus assembly protein CpaB [Bacillus freudenreichii]